MQLSIYQIVSLAIHGNAALQGFTGYSAEKFYPANRVFSFCEQTQFVHFVKTSDKWKEQIVARTPIDWFDLLREEGCFRLGVSYHQSGNRDLPDHMLVGFVGGGGHWLIEATGPAGVDTGKQSGKSEIRIILKERSGESPTGESQVHSRLCTRRLIQRK